MIFATRSQLGRWGGFMAVASALGLCFSASSLPTPLYPLYQTAWGIQPSALSYIFTAYMIGVLPSLICFGRLSDTLGRFRIVMISLSMLMLGLFLSAIASGITLLIIARFIIGFGNGLLTTTSVVALAEAHPKRDRHVAAVTTSMAISVAFGLGPVIGGSLAQIGIAPLVLPYIVVFAAALLNMLLVLKYRTLLMGPYIRAPLSISPQLALPGAARRGTFFLACGSGFATFAVGSLFASMVPSLLRTALPWKGPLVVGLAFLLMASACVTIQLTQRNVHPFRGMVLGMLGFIIAVTLLVAGLAVHNVVVLAVGMLSVGVGQGYAFMSSAVIAGISADEGRRTANMSTYFLAAYMGATAPIIAVGLLADSIGLEPAIYVYSALIGCLMLALAILAWPRQADPLRG
ncbi:MFS transporter [Eoetvoesiella caeni]